ncbi:MAG: aminotransferase class V-fold PLP-dependent enzyme [Gemmatimonadota bacterium]|nr:aminotransferase class V-fold PLP-dependent enzyme [Gemmatimonadota bacterium]
MTRSLACQRHAFSLPGDHHYLNCAYMGPLPLASEEAAIRGLRKKRFPQVVQVEDFFRPVEELKARFARLIGAPSGDNVAIVPSVSYGMAAVTGNTELGPGRNVVVMHEQFPANVYPWRRLAQDRGGEVRVISPREGCRGQGWSERVLDAIDDATVAVAMGTVHWTDGTRYDLPAIRRRTRDVGAALIVDGSQSVGAAPIDVSALAPDALICAGYKWLLGPYSVSLAYFGDRYLGGRPVEETWIARKGSEDFRRLVEYQDEYQPGAVRFDVGQRSNFALVPSLSASLALLLEWTPAAITEYCRELFTTAIDSVQEWGVGVEEEPWRSPHLFGLRLPADVSIGGVQAAFEAHRVGVSFRGSSVRVSPNVYNTPEDVTAFLSALKEGMGR